MIYIRIFLFSAGLVRNRYDYMRFLVRLRFTFVSLLVHLSELASELAWSREVNQFTWVSQPGFIQLRVLFIEEFTILLSRVKKRFNFWCGLEVNEFHLHNWPLNCV